MTQYLCSVYPSWDLSATQIFHLDIYDTQFDEEDIIDTRNFTAWILDIKIIEQNYKEIEDI